MFNFIRIKSTKHLLDAKTTAGLCLSLCLLYMDYCNSILYGLPDVTINKMQRLQNMCACLVSRRAKWQSATKCLMDLHWLPICQRIIHKILTLTYKCRHNCGPKYLRDLLEEYQSSRQGLCSNKFSTDLLVILPTKRKIFAERSFSVAAQKLWKQLPQVIRQAESELTFKCMLKTHLFKQAFLDG